MKKLFAFALAMALLLSAAPALAEISWGAWVQEETNYWTRQGLDPSQPDMRYREYAYGPALEELRIDGYEETRLDGAWTYLTGTYYWPDGSIELVNEITMYNGSTTERVVRAYHHPDGIHSSTAVYVYENGELTYMEREDYDVQGNLMQIQVRSYDSEGRKLEDVYYTPEGSLTMTTSYEYLENEEIIITSTRPDGSLSSRIQEIFLIGSEEGERYYRRIILESYDSNQNLVTLSEIRPDGSVLERALNKTSSGGIQTFTQLIALDVKGDIRLSYFFAEYDKFGNFVEGMVYDPETGEYLEAAEAPMDDLLRDEWFKRNGKPVEEMETEPLSFVWYPSNTLTTAGLAFREEKPELTGKWYQFTPLDLSRDGRQEIELVGGSVYLLGKVIIEVEGDKVTVDYSISHGIHGNVMMESEFFTLFPDLAGVTSVEPEDLGEGYKFGEALSIRDDLQGDTRVLLFVRNVATFADHVRAELPRTRYWHNHPGRVQNREALRALMD